MLRRFAATSATSRRRSRSVAPVASSAILTPVFFTMVLTGCSLAPQYDAPTLAGANHFKEADHPSGSAFDGRGEDGPHGASVPAGAVDADSAGLWKAAQPSDQALRGAWWRVFDDPVLDQLESDASRASPTLQAAFSRVQASRALQQVARADLFPSIDAGFGPTREKLSPASQLRAQDVTIPSQTLWRAQADVSYEVDLFGKVSDANRAAQADAMQSEALYRSTLLTLQADVAQRYFTLREEDAELAIYRRNVTLREAQLQFVQHRFDEGEVSELDLAQAKTELAGTRADAMSTERQRATTEHALAVLLGRTPAEFSLAAAPLVPVRIDIPPGLPSDLLERRPDVAAAERAMAAANARIGVAKGAYFPSLSLTGSAGVESATLGDLFKWSSRAFLLGPLAGTALSVPIFDGGRRRGNLANARAAYEEDAANYRQTVLQAFQEVEDSLSDLRILKTQTRTQDAAVAASQRAAHISQSQYREGAANYLSVIDAERNVLQSQRSAAQLYGVQAGATVKLIRALGGGWGSDAKPLQHPS